MCFRLLAVITDFSPRALGPLGVSHGLDLRFSSAHQGEGTLVEIGWGDCACSLYTRKEGRERVVGWVEAILERGGSVQLLLLSDGDSISWRTPKPEEVPFSRFEQQGLQALTEGSVVQITPERLGS